MTGIPRCSKHDCEMVPVTTDCNGKPRRQDAHYRCPQCVAKARAKIAFEVNRTGGGRGKRRHSLWSAVS